MKLPNKENKYPYNPWTPSKVELTMGELELYPQDGILKTTMPPKKGGSETQSKIMVFTADFARKS